MFKAQRNQAEVNLQQLIGAIYACELMIKKHEEENNKTQLNENDVNIENKHIHPRCYNETI